ncbi:ABC transporter permease [Shinella sp. BYT-45]|uniref:ABC transporter permease n=1 Tax=Shinella sp. BYT-45 TaxID=3377377 RepID=UPI003980E151
MIARRLALSLALPLLLLLAWQVLGLAASPGSRMPTPLNVLRAAWDMSATGDLPTALLQSLGRVSVGFAVSATLALVIGTLMASYRAVGRSLDPLVESFRPIAPMALLPLAILWFGTGTGAAAFLVGYAAFFPMLVNTVHGVAGVDPGLVRAARSLGVGKLTILRTVVLPGALSHVFVGARLALGVAWTSIIAAELAVGAKSGGGTSGGIGQAMFVFYAYSIDLDRIVVCMMSVGLVALLIDGGVRSVQQRIMPWKAR